MTNPTVSKRAQELAQMFTDAAGLMYAENRVEFKRLLLEAFQQYGREVREAAAKKAVDYTIADKGHSNLSVQANAAQNIAADIREMDLP